MKRLPCAMNCDWDSGLDWKRKKESISISLMKMLNVQQKEGQDLTSYLSSVSTRQLQKESSRVSDQCWTLDSTCVSSSVRLSVCLLLFASILEHLATTAIYQPDCLPTTGLRKSQVDYKMPPRPPSTSGECRTWWISTSQKNCPLQKPARTHLKPLFYGQCVFFHSVCWLWPESH